MPASKKTHSPSILKDNDIFPSFNMIQEMIQDRAFQLFNERDPDAGDAMTDWLQAEREILSDINMTLKDNDKEVLIEGKFDKFLPEDIEIKVKDGVFTICGIHDEKTTNRKKGVSGSVSTQSKFFKSFPLPGVVDAEKMKVDIRNGKFSAKIPKISH